MTRVIVEPKGIIMIDIDQELVGSIFRNYEVAKAFQEKYLTCKKCNLPLLTIVSTHDGLDPATHTFERCVLLVSCSIHCTCS